MAKRKDLRRLAMSQNVFTKDYYTNLLFNIATIRYEWSEELPLSVDRRILESALSRKGKAVIYKEPVTGDLIGLPCVVNSPLNVYGYPTAVTAYGFNGYQCNVSIGGARKDLPQGVLIYNNTQACPDVPVIEWYAYKMYEISRSFDNNSKMQKFPSLIRSSFQQKLTMENLMMDYEGNVPFIFGDNSLNLEGMEAIDLHVPFLLDKLYFSLHDVFNDALSYLGIENANIQKRERVSTEETSSALGFTQAQRMTGLIPREKACKEMKALFGIDCSVKFRDGLSEMYRLTDIGEEGGNNGKVYDNDPDDM